MPWEGWIDGGGFVHVEDEPPDPSEYEENPGLYACATCGEPVRLYGQRCERCKRNIEEDCLERESGR